MSARRANRRAAGGPGSSPARTPSSQSPPPSSSPIREDDDGEDLVDESMARDYRPMPELDRYEDVDLGSDDVDELTAEQRREAERRMRKRDLDTARRAGRRVDAVDSDEEEAPRQRRRIAGDDEKEEADAEVEAVQVNLEDVRGPLREYIQLDAPRREIARRFRYFLQSVVDNNGEAIYTNLISRMCSENKSSLPINYVHLSQAVPILAVWTADAPKEMLEILDQAALKTTLAMFPDYEKVTDQIHVRITDLPIEDKLRDLRQIHLNVLVKVSGVVTRRTSVFPQLKLVRFNCAKCGYLTNPIAQNDTSEVTPPRCANCQQDGPFTVNSERTVYRNYQKLTLQESPGTVPPGRVPRQKDVILLHDLIDSARPGEEVEVTGIYVNSFDTVLNNKHGFPVFKTVIEANNVRKKSDHLETFALTDEDVQEIIKLSKKPNVAQIIFNSIGPSIYGHENIKIGLALAMFGGMSKQLQNKHRLRGDINVLVLGDPGTGKSQFLKYVEKTAPRAVYTTGKGASAVGLTAAVRNDPLTREWTLEGGALVLADQGVCLIDEFDKMNDQDRTSIHEAMEQQSISISKAGIITTLQARCSVIAAANPISGRYDSSISFAENVNLTDAILSRFDVLCVVRDTVDPIADGKLASFVVDSHARSHPVGQADREANGNGAHDDHLTAGDATDGAAIGGASDSAVPSISQDLLRKYIMYARKMCKPKLQNVDQDKIAKLYGELRRESMISGGIPIAVRHIESLIRMAEAHAKMHLRDFVRDDDVNMAIRVMLESFISTQKFSVMRALRKHFNRYITYKKDTFELLLFLLRQMVREQSQLMRLQNQDVAGNEPITIELRDFRDKANELDISDLSAFFSSEMFKNNNFVLDKANKQIIQRL